MRKPIKDINTIDEVDSEIEQAKNELPKYTKRLRWTIPLLTAFAFVFPYLPGRRGREPMTESWGYQNSVIFCIVLWAFLLILTYGWIKDKSSKRVRELQLKKHLLEKESDNN